MKITKAFVTSDGQAFQDASKAQEHEIEGILSQNLDPDGRMNVSIAASCIVANKDKVIDWLTTTANSKPAARKVNGGTKTRKPKAADAQAAA